ncbi:hypothetical protein FOCC_FOCC007607 [Frankliniella occidentalis]|nr:hypothetical protein FOCC_FOCC007607 [Frankliniella occidentalis]
MDIDMAIFHGELRERLQRVEAGREERVAAGAYDGVPSVAELLAGRDVLVTGGSGFLGRVLLEKLLRSCPDIGTVFLLLRAKRGVPPEERVAGIVNVPLFDQLRREQPTAISKLVPVAGDCAELGLGLSPEDRAILQDRVFIVFHGAASVRFDDPVAKAVLLNTRGAREALAEQAMADAAATVPIVIVRPSIGWLDNLNSPSTMWATANMGVLRVSKLSKPEIRFDWMPVDIVTKATIVAADVLPVVNAALKEVHPVTEAQMRECYNATTIRTVPFTSAVRYPIFIHPTCWLHYQVMHVVYHIMFGLVVDTLLRLSGQKPRLMEVYRKIAAAEVALVPIAERSHITFETPKFWDLQRLMHPDDVKNFDFDLDSLDPRKDCVNLISGIWQYTLKGKLDKENGLRRIDRLFWMEMGFHVFLVAILMYIVLPI